METYNPNHFIITLSLLLLRVLIPTSATQDDLIVATANGRVQGARLSVPGGSSVLAFLGIPYGKPPIRELRFKAPEPVEGWAGVRDATRFPNSCSQALDTAFPGFSGAEMWNPNTQMSEDCLYLNVWTPRSAHTASSLAPVMVWIYGGGFTSGTSSLDLYDGRFLSQSEDVVVVSMNYRLGALGFLTLPEASSFRGNNGLLDQRLALSWTANNIAAFGGDPSKVTLFGESAGAASVGLHLLSPASHGLFHRAILQSGAPNAQWATLTQAEAWSRALSLSKLLGCPLSPPADLELCLQRADHEDILRQQFNVLTQPALMAIPFTPVVDEQFLPDQPEVLLQTGNFLKTEIMIGLNKDEGTYFLINGAPGFDINSQSLISRQDFLKGVGLSLSEYSNITRESAVLHYTDWTDVRNETNNRDSLSRIVGDAFFSCPVIHFAHKYTEHGGKTHLYFFDHRSSTNPWPEWMGVMHAYEIEFVLGKPLNSSLGYAEEEVAMSRAFMRRWANFARTGNPSIKEGDWPIFTTDRQEYVTLNPAPPRTERKLLAQHCQLWSHLVPELEGIADDLQSCLNDGVAVQCTSAVMLMLFLLCITLGLVQ